LICLFHLYVYFYVFLICVSLFLVFLFMFVFKESDLDFLVDTTGTNLTSLLRLGELYCDLEDAFDKRIDLVTVRAIMQTSNMASDIEFRETVMRERVRLDDVA